MADGVTISYQTLDELHARLSRIHTELENAERNADTLAGAIGTPFGRRDLAQEVERFADAWDDKRDSLRRDLSTVMEHTRAILDGWQQWDDEAARTLTPEF